MRLRSSNCINVTHYQETLLCPGGKKSSSFLFSQTVTIVDSKVTSNIFFRRDTAGLTHYQETLLCPGGKKSSSFLFSQTVTIVDSKATSNIFFRRDTAGLTHYQETLLCPGGKKSSSFLFSQTVTIVDSKATSNIFFRRDTAGLTPQVDSCVNSLIPCCNLLVMAVASCLLPSPSCLFHKILYCQIFHYML